MTEVKDWLEQTWEIKRKLAEHYANVSPSEQLRDMYERTRIEWEKRGWTLKMAESPDHAPPRPRG